MKSWVQIWVVLAVCLLLTGGLFGDVTVQITEPAAGSVLTPCTDVTLKADVTVTEDETIKDVRFYFNDRQKYRDRKAPWEYTWKSIDRGIYDFTAKATTSDGLEYFSDPVHVKVGPISSGEILFNGSFDCGKTSNWTMFAHSPAEAVYEIYDDNYFDDTYYLYVEIENGGSEIWHVQASIACPSDSGHIYEISFLADAMDPKTIDISMQENQEPWAVQMNMTVDIDGPDLYGPFEFVATKTDPTNQLRFNIGANTIPFFLDDVQVIDRSMAGVTAKRLAWNGAVASLFELEQAYPNPFNMDTNIRFTLSEAATISLDIFNMQGQKVRTLANGAVQAGRHNTPWNGMMNNGQAAPSGVYLYRLVGESSNGAQFDLSRKILLLK